MKILLGEDNRADVYLIRKALRASPIPVTLDCVTDGELLLTYVLRQGVYAHTPTPDLIILDLAMPRKDGWEVVRELKATPELYGIPVVVFAGVLTPAMDQQLAALGVAWAVQKPLDVTRYEDVLRGLVAWWQRRLDAQAL